MRLFALLPLLMLLAAPPANAEVVQVFPVESCVVSAGHALAARRECIGAAARDCIDSNPANQTTGGMSDCVAEEGRAWQILSAQYEAALRARESATQIALLDAYLEQHRAWAAARCAYNASYYEGGSLARLLAASCRRDTAAELALELYARVFDEGI